jgi:hypothetical protein
MDMRVRINVSKPDLHRVFVNFGDVDGIRAVTLYGQTFLARQLIGQAAWHSILVYWLKKIGLRVGLPLRRRRTILLSRQYYRDSGGNHISEAVPWISPGVAWLPTGLLTMATLLIVRLFLDSLSPEQK